jgi:hypothetical protein
MRAVRASLAMLVALSIAAGCRCGDDGNAGAPDDVAAPHVADAPGAAADGAPGRAATGSVAAAERRGEGAAAVSRPSGDPGASPSRPASGSPAVTDEAAFLAAAGARPAWTAARDRADLLARHGHRGAAWGHLRRDASGQTWLIDPTETATTLGIRLAGSGGRALDPGRIVAWGAWAVDDQRRWTWQVERMVALPADARRPAPPDPLPSPPLPAHLVGEQPQPPEGALPPSQLHKSGPIVFVVLAPPAKPGDGWTIADQGGKAPPTALLVLPGEAAIYGGLDYLSADERWPLAVGSWYAVSAAAGKSSRARPSASTSKPRPGKPGKPPAPGDLPVLRALAPPARVPPPPSASKKPSKAGATVRDR